MEQKVYESRSKEIYKDGREVKLRVYLWTKTGLGGTDHLVESKAV